MDPQNIRLTQTVKKGGCAAKLPAGLLREVLRELPISRLPELLVGIETFDDASLLDLGDDRLLVQTLDFFTPIVDDPYEFGAIAAANSMSDVYAMGGSPKTALTILAFPMATLPSEILKPMMSGAIQKIHEAGAALAGGHTIDDETLKLGFSVTGFVDRDKAWTNSGARPGDALILTKALGTGTLMSALKAQGDLFPDLWLRSAIESMMLLNTAPELLHGIKVNAATDITGFGLLGHSLQLAQASKVRLNLAVESLPLLPGFLDCLTNGVTNRAHKTNYEYTQSCLSNLDLTQSRILTDAQTSGGLLLSVPQIEVPKVLERLVQRFPCVREIGFVSEDAEGPRVKIEI